MTDTSDDVAEPPRRRRRASRRAAGPPVSVSTAAAAELIETIDAEEAVDPTIGADDTTEDVAVLTDPADAAPSGADAAGAVADGAVAGITAAVATGPAAGHAHGSPAGAPEHHPGPSVHGHTAAGAHSPAQSHSSSAPGRERPGERPPSGGGGAGEPARRSGRPTREEASERSLRSLVTTRSTQVSPTAALRAREVALPTAADLEAAEADLVIVRRHYVPPTTLAAGRRQDWPGRRGAGGQGGRPAGG